MTRNARLAVARCSLPGRPVAARCTTPIVRPYFANAKLHRRCFILAGKCRSPITRSKQFGASEVPAPDSEQSDAED
jgi:hypothetical protein